MSAPALAPTAPDTPPAPAGVIPALHYDRAAEIIAWLERAFGFEPQLVHAAPDGRVVHAELRTGPGPDAGWLMVGSAEDSGLGVRPPRRLGGATASFYLVVGDPDAHHARARAAGAEVVRAPADMPYGGREYTARDPEGQLWSFGTYRPAPRPGGGR